MKKGLLKKFYASLIMVLVAAISLGTSTYAWFSMNNTVTVSGMEVTAVAEGNLVVNKLAEVPMGGTDVYTTFAGESYKLKPMTWDSAWKIPTKGYEIDQKTGKVASDALTAIAAAKWEEAEASKVGYYKDYLIYIASAGEELTEQKLYVIFNEVTLEEFYKGALSIAFYVNNAAPDQTTVPTDTISYKEFMELVEGDPDTEAYKEGEDEEIRIQIGTDTYTIPSCMQAAAGLAITMRVYFDGQLDSYLEKDYYNVVKTPVEEDLKAGKYYNYDTTAGVYKNIEANDSLTLDSTITYREKVTALAKYINSNELPVANCKLEVKFIAEGPAE